MLRVMLAVVHSLLMIAVLFVGAYYAAYRYLGPDGLFKPGNYDVALNGLIVTLSVVFVAAVIGGFGCAMMSGSGKGAPILAALLLLFGVLWAASLTMEAKPPERLREGTATWIEAIDRVQPPPWLPWSIPVVAAVGCLLGSRLSKSES